MHVIMVVTYGEPKKGYLNFTLGNLWATQPIALLIWPPLHNNRNCTWLNVRPCLNIGYDSSPPHFWNLVRFLLHY